MKLQKVFIYLFFIFFPVGYIARIKLGNNISILPQDFVFLVIAISWLFNLSKLKKLVQMDSFLVLQTVFIFVGLGSLIINSFYFGDINFITSMLYAIRYFSVLLIIPSIKISEKIDIKKALYLSGLVFLVIGFLQYVFVYDLRPYTYLGWDDHLYRLFSTFLDPNYAGVFLSVYFIFLIEDIIKKPFYKCLYYIFTAFFTFVAIYLTYSRSALLALFLGLLTYLIVIRKVKIVFFVVVVLVFFLFLFKDSTVEGSNPLRSVSSSNRLASVKQAFKIFQKNPLIGVGFNSYRYAQIRYSVREIAGSSKSNADAGTDNSFIFVLATTGVIGFAAFCLGYFLLFKNFLIESSHKALLLSVFICLFTGSVFINALFYIPILSWIFVLLGWTKNTRADK